LCFVAGSSPDFALGDDTQKRTMGMHLFFFSYLPPPFPKNFLPCRQETKPPTVWDFSHQSPDDQKAGYEVTSVHPLIKSTNVPKE
jgi:hypothetical protein